MTLNNLSFINPYKSQNNQDRYLREKIFKNKKNGFFFDIGAYNGVMFSNTFYFENYQNWKGICIEPNPHIFEQLTKNRNCNLLNICVSDYNGSQNFASVKSDIPILEMFSGLEDKYSPKHKNYFERYCNQLTNKIEKTIIKVECKTVNQIFEDFKVKEVDLFKIDTEGGELEILKTINYDKYFIDIICVENNYDDPNFRIYLESINYKYLTKIGKDEIYQKNK